MNILFKKYSTMVQEKVFSDTFSTTALCCLRGIRIRKIISQYDLQELTDFIMKKERTTFLILIR